MRLAWPDGALRHRRLHDGEPRRWPTAARRVALDPVGGRRSSASSSATVVGLFIGAISSRSDGIYFLMITLAFGVLTVLFFGKVNAALRLRRRQQRRAARAHREPAAGAGIRLYYTRSVASVGVYLLIRYLVRTPFGLALQGIRDEPTRMRALGYNVALHRTARVRRRAPSSRRIGGILFVWWNAQISPGSIDLGADDRRPRHRGRRRPLPARGRLGRRVRLRRARQLRRAQRRTSSAQRFNTVIGAALPRYRPPLAGRPRGHLGRPRRALRSRQPARTVEAAARSRTVESTAMGRRTEAVTGANRGEPAASWRIGYRETPRRERREAMKSQHMAGTASAALAPARRSRARARGRRRRLRRRRRGGRAAAEPTGGAGRAGARGAASRREPPPRPARPTAEEGPDQDRHPLDLRGPVRGRSTRRRSPACSRAVHPARGDPGRPGRSERRRRALRGRPGIPSRSSTAAPTRRPTRRSRRPGASSSRRASRSSIGPLSGSEGIAVANYSKESRTSRS